MQLPKTSCYTVMYTLHLTLCGPMISNGALYMYYQKSFVQWHIKQPFWTAFILDIPNPYSGHALTKAHAEGNSSLGAMVVWSNQQCWPATCLLDCADHHWASCRCCWAAVVAVQLTPVLAMLRSGRQIDAWVEVDRVLGKQLWGLATDHFSNIARGACLEHWSQTHLPA